jgi:gluconolactonase
MQLSDFTLLTEELDHPETVIWGPDDRVWAGGEGGQIYAITLDGAVEQVADTAGAVLGLAFDGDGILYACDEGRCEVLRIDPASGSVEVYADRCEGVPMDEPNYLAFDAAGNLFVTDSGDWHERDGRIYRITPDGAVGLWTRSASRYPNGCLVTPDGSWLYVVESSAPAVVRLAIRSDGSAGEPASVVDLPPLTVPDGIALDTDGNLYIACYRPDRIYRFTSGGSLEVLADDPQAMTLNTPTNIAFVGSGRAIMAVANVGEWHILTADVGATGVAPFLPRLVR